MRLKIFFASLIAAAMLATVANAGPVWLYLAVNPATDADAGGTLDGTSTVMGANSWHLYALDDTDGSQGIAGYSVTLSNIETILNRSPSTLYEDTDGNTDITRGFRFLRSGNDTTPPVAATSNPVFGQQPLNPGEQIFGYGQESSDFATEITNEASLSSTTSGSWGDYATDPAVPPPDTDGKSWLFLAEGLSTTGMTPGILASRIQVYNAQGGIIDVEEQIFQLVTNNPPLVGDLDEGDVFRNATQNLGPLPANDPDGDPLTWTLISFSGANEGNGGAGYAFSVDPLTGEFDWDAAHDDVSTGPYTAVLRATDPGGLFDEGTLRFNVIVPEPASIALLGIAMVGCVGLVRRRNG